MKKDSEPVQIYTLTLRREVPITNKAGTATGEVKHFIETHKGCTYEQGLELRKKTLHVADAMFEKLRMGVPGRIESSTDIGYPVNMPAPRPRKPREPFVRNDASSWGKPSQRAPQSRETPIAKRDAPGGGTYADLINKMAEEEAA